MNVCFFDIDGTLVNTGGAGGRAMLETMAAQFGVTQVGDEVSFSGRTDRAIVYDLLKLHRLQPTVERWRSFVETYLEHLGTLLPVCSGRILPGITQLLDELGQRGDVAVGLLTGNVREGARLKLDHYALGDHFSFGGFGDEHQDRLDVARDAMESARKQLGSEPTGTVVVIGDTRHDVRCARAIGAKAVAVATGEPTMEELSAAKPDLLLESIGDPSVVMRLFD